MSETNKLSRWEEFRVWLACWIVATIATKVHANAVVALCLRVAHGYYERNPEELEAVEIE